jgi:hypothetical protein
MTREKKKREGRRRSFRDMIKMSHGRREEAASKPAPEDRPFGVIRFETGKLPTEFAEFGNHRGRRVAHSERAAEVIAPAARPPIYLVLNLSDAYLLTVFDACPSRGAV